MNATGAFALPRQAISISRATPSRVKAGAGAPPRPLRLPHERAVVSDHSTAKEYARQLAKYIKDPSTIRARVVEYYSQRVPSLDDIKRIQRDMSVTKRVKNPKGKEYQVKETDGDHFAVRGLVKEPVFAGQPVATNITRQPVPSVATPAAKMWPNWYEPPPRSNSYAMPQHRLLASVAMKHSTTIDDICSRDRRMEKVDARRVVAVVLKARGWSYPRIGRLLGGRDHSTIMNLCKTAGPRAARDRFLRASIDYHMAEFGPAKGTTLPV